MISKIKDNKNIAITWPSIAFLTGILWTHGDRLIPNNTTSKLPMLLAVQIGITLFLALLGMSLTVAFLILKYNQFKDFLFDPSSGSWQHKNKEMWLCASCKVDGKFSPLMFVDEKTHEMSCPKCGQIARNFKLKSMRVLSDISSPKIEDFIKK